MNDQLPPHDIQAEEACIAAALVDPDAIDQMPNLESAHFWREPHGWAWKAIQDLHHRGSVVDQVTLSAELTKRRDEGGDQTHLDAIGGMSHLAELTQRLPVNLGAAWWAGLVTEAWHKRQLLSQAHGLIQAVYRANSEQTAADLASKWSDRLSRVAVNRDRKLTQWPNDVLDAPASEGGGLHDKLHNWLVDPSSSMGFRTGIDLFDDVLRGLHIGRLYTLLANTSQGKSWLVDFIALQLAVSGVPVWICSTEMSALEIGQRLIGMLAGVDRYKVERREATEGDIAALMAAENEYRTLPIGVMSVGRPRLSNVLAEARRQVKAEGIGVVLIDHIQHIRPDDSRGVTNEAAWMAEVVASFKALATESMVAVFQVSHVGRADAKAGTIGVHSGKNSSAIEQDADVGIVMQAVEWANRQDMATKKFRWGWWPLDASGMSRFQETWNAVPILLEIDKNRHGPRERGVVHLDWSMGGRFEPFDQHRPEAKAPEKVPT